MKVRLGLAMALLEGYKTTGLRTVQRLYLVFLSADLRVVYV